MPHPTFLITGATDGIGRQTALALARQGAHVLVHGRRPERGQAVLAEIQAAGGTAAYLNADLAALRQVRALAAEVAARYPRLDGLIANAGVFTRERQLSQDGFELTFAVNHLAHFLLVNLLLETLRRSAPARVVVVASMVHHSGRLDLDDLQAERGFDGYAAYANSKLANVLFTGALAERLAGSGVTANSLHPGVIATKLLRAGWGGGGADLEAGAAASVYLATAPEVAGVTGRYFEGRRERAAARAAQDRELQARLWQISAALTGLG